MENYDPSLGMPMSVNAGGPKEKVQLFISCRGLKDLDYISKSDPLCTVWLKNDERSQWVKIAQTDTVENNLNPDFTIPITLDYYFEKTQHIRFEVWDQDPSRVEEQGMHTTKVGSLIGAKNQTYIGELQHSTKKGKRGRIIVRSDCVKESNKTARIRLSCSGLKSKTKLGIFKTNNPFLVIKRCLRYDQGINDHEQAVKVFTSPVLNSTLNPSWNLGELKLETLCNSDIDLPLIIEIWSYHKNGNHRIYGRVVGTVREFADNQGSSIDIIKKQGKPYGKLRFEEFMLIERPSMMDYIRSGWMISLSVAIDFTASNGELSDPYSLHYINPMDPSKMTPYEQAIYQVGNILEPYDATHSFPVFGFGAIPRFMGLGEISHCFHLNGCENPEVVGVNGILEAYRNALLGGIGLYGPTNFSPCLETISEFIRGRQHLTEYHILLYITDGAITDMKETIDNVVEASNLPLSIIIIGVGNSDFSKMEQLDSDQYALRSSYGKSASRDIVQFVEFNTYAKDITFLHEDVLREVPGQLVSYMMNNNIPINYIDHIRDSQIT